MNHDQAQDRFGRRFLVAMLVVFAVYTLFYLAFPALPGNWREHPLGWWGWYDQSQYLKSAEALRDRIWDGRSHQYPPLWPLFGAFFVRSLPSHAFFIPSFLCLAVHLWALLRIGEKLYGALLTWIVVALTLLVYREVTMTQWVIPWNSSLSAALSSLLFLIYFRFERLKAPWTLSRARDWFAVAALYVCYGALLATRPLDVLTMFPVVLLAFVRLAFTNCWPLDRAGTWRRASALVGVITTSGLLIPAAYLTFNKLLYGSPFGGYLGAAPGQGLYFSIIPEQAVSLAIDSMGLSLAPSATLTSRFPIFLAGVSVCAVVLVAARGILPVIAGTILFHLLVYCAFADFTPNNIFGIGLVHYIKWTFPWLALILVGQALHWLGRNEQRRVMWWPIVASLAITIALAGLRVVVPRLDAIADRRDQQGLEIVIDSAAPQTWHVVDMLDVRGGFNEIYMSRHVLKLDGRELRRTAEYRLLPVDWGTRLIFVRPLTGKTIDLKFGKPVSLGGGPSGVSLRGAASIAMTCALQSCASVTYFSVGVANPLVIDMRAGHSGSRLTSANWREPEGWGTWTRAKRATLTLALPEQREISLSAKIRPLLSPQGPTQTATLSVNGCVIAQQKFDWAGGFDSKTIGAPVPARCIGDDGTIEVAIETDVVRTPHSIGIGTDRRQIGVGVETIEIRR
jgi:hypothetical protein